MQIKPVIQIGPVSSDPAESVSSVNQAFIRGLADCYEFVAPSADRKYGATRQAHFNAWNIYYLVKHAISWTFTLVSRRPAVAHYALTSGWALEKGLVFLWLARLFGAKTVGHLHGGDFIEFWSVLSPKRKRFAGHQLGRLDAFVVLSGSWRKSVSEIVGVPDNKLFVVNNPIDRDFEESALKIPVLRDDIVILSLGVMGRDKGVLDIVEAVGLIRGRNHRFRVQLAGPEREPGILAEVERSLEKHSVTGLIDLLPAIWGEAKGELFRKASIFLLPSYVENFPLVVLEAAAAGHAIIASPVGATPEFFENGISAIFVEPGNSEQIAQAILQLLENPEDRIRLGHAARKVFEERLGRSGIEASLDSVYRSVLNNPACRDAVKT